MDAKKMKVKELRAALEERELDTSGLKAVLQQRLTEALENDQTEEREEVQAPEEPVEEKNQVDEEEVAEEVPPQGEDVDVDEEHSEEHSEDKEKKEEEEHHSDEHPKRARSPSPPPKREEKEGKRRKREKGEPCCRRCRSPAPGEPRKRCVCRIPASIRRANLIGKGCRSCGCEGCSREDDEGVKPRPPPPRRGNPAEGCCEQCVRALGAQRACVCQVSWEIRRQIIPLEGCRVCGCTGCHHHDVEIKTAAARATGRPNADPLHDMPPIPPPGRGMPSLFAPPPPMPSYHDYPPPPSRGYDRFEPRDYNGRDDRRGPPPPRAEYPPPQYGGYSAPRSEGHDYRREYR